MEYIGIDMGTYACLIFLEDVMLHLSSEVHMVDQGNRNNSSGLGSPLSTTVFYSCFMCPLLPALCTL